jgi:hypothetical protein
LFEGEENIRFYIRIEDLMLFKNLMLENNILIKNEVEQLTNTNSQTFYSKKNDFNKIDEICKENNIIILDGITPYFNNEISIKKLPKSIQIIIQILIFLIILFFLIQKYI